MMPMDPAAIDPREIDKKLQQSLALRLRTSVSRLAFRVQAANIGHTDTVRVVALTMRPRLTDRPSPLDRSIKPDNIMIPDRLPTSLLVPGSNVGSRKILPGSGSRAVDYYVINVSRHDNRLKPGVAKRIIIILRPRVAGRLFIVRKGTNFG